MRPHDDEHVLELGPDVGDEGQGAGLLENMMIIDKIIEI